ncbi:exopolysaccharide biosynthesis polyprenyl glycosylphosphotransferase [Oleidesulfovibrio alaskensis G20]|jgi:sugar transferase (PEP-CTERM system associated)|uniref:Exopolysaccharide biosynthesis polyprenyl glycosylphosphotransferase n=1 Tax=Oleidesulfovibrio alaskensis (strain ATCC BAA-1058 / DSM 17464 / G20) TaxID=207559 RepID=Q314L6_OLEA2|nr:TIGR03013 family XrtA/PEP-CTERM system glycosyltransferase [Oleidesulfovibrio alaskensis]ABB37630.1 exopolysaccharide biosynthesis polyprenyl glycosylphosphotransferase [Oleidesulfovibrio alaskensis G20]MBG0773550.1 TIGR03013 family PEP-CTERM/XrtA system glycosyltransferase [Oleidesulfovibrio alaskensis]
MTVSTFSTLVQDTLWLLLALLLAAMPALGHGGLAGLPPLSDAALLALVILACTLIVERLDSGHGNNSRAVIRITAAALLLASLVILGLRMGSGLFERQEGLAVAVMGWFALFRCGGTMIRRYWEFIPVLAPGVLIVGNGELADAMRTLVLESRGRYRLKGFVECSANGGELADTLDGLSLLEYARKNKVRKMVVSLTERRGAFPLDEVLRCRMNGIEVVDAASFYEEANKKLYIENITPSWFIFSQGFRISAWRRLGKRVMDVVFSSLGLLLTAPFFPLMALLIKLDSPGPVFFRQVRVGAGDSEFVIFKFRSMRCDAEEKTGAVWAKVNDPRVTRLGNFLRRSRIDEIPQLINVIRGEMSLVGPRPERPEFVRTLRRQIPFYSERHYMKPGVTGWAQVRYPYGASEEDAIEKLRYDLYYIKNYSILFDLRIMLDTVGVVLFRKGGR